MVKSSFLTAALAVTLLALTAGCSSDEPPAASTSPSPTPSVAKAPPPSAVKPKAPSPSASPSASLKKDTFVDATDAAASAATIAQSAESRDDWDLVASRWQEAIKLMKQVPRKSKNYALAQKKAAEYQNNLAYAKKMTTRPPKAASPASSPPAGAQPTSSPAPKKPA